MTGKEEYLYLEQLVQEAKALLINEGQYYTKGNKLALMDMLEQGELALKGEDGFIVEITPYGDR